MFELSWMIDADLYARVERRFAVWDETCKGLMARIAELEAVGKAGA